VSELFRDTARELSARLARGEVSSREVVMAHLDRIAAVDGDVRAFTHVFRDRALADADRADDERRRGEARGPLHGLPVSIKECFDIEGQPTTLGIPSWRTKVAERDAAMVRLLREAGAVVLGRTNLSQTMLYVESRNPLFGQTANPWKTSASPGGSSGGEAAAIAAGMSPLGIGTDIGGSIRTPCTFTGIAGLKPTLDRLPARGYRAVLAGQEVVRSMCGPMARTTGDLVMLLRALDPRRMSALDSRVPPLPWEDPAQVELRGLRVGVCTEDGFLPPSGAVVRAVERAAAALHARGCEVVPFTPPGIADAVTTYLAALSSDGGAMMREALDGGEVDVVLRPLLRLAGVPAAGRRALARVAELAGEVRLSRMLRAMGEKPVAELWRLTDRARAYRHGLLEALDAARIDLVVSPAYATPAMPHGLSKNFTLASSYALLWNFVQLPAGVVPVTRVRPDEADRDAPRDSLEKQARKIDRASAGLPVGAQIAARPWADALVLAAMAAVEDEVKSDEGFPRTPVDPHA
jgi:fatty acid amide hydrolase